MNFIKTCFNSFFRTLGRILCYVAIGTILSFLFSKIDVHAESISVSNASVGYVLIDNATFNYQDIYNKLNTDKEVRFSINVPLSYSDIYSYAFIDICSGTDIWTYRSSGIGASCSQNCFSNQTLTTKTNYICTTGDYQGKIYRVSVPIAKWERDTADELASVSDRLSFGTSQASWNPMRIYGVYLTDTSDTGQYQVDYTDTINSIGGSISNVGGKIDDTNSKINDTNTKLDEAENTRKGIWETIKGIPESIANLIKGLFIPDNFDFLNDFKETLSNKLGFIAEVPIKLLDFIISLADFTWTEFSSITFPKIEILGVSFWNDITIDVGPILGGLKKYRYITDVLCVTLCVNTLRKMYDKFTGGSGE